MIEKLAGFLGIKTFTVGLVAGLTLAAGPAGWGGYKVGHLIGYGAGTSDANQQATINDLTRQLAEKERDRAAAENRAEAMREQSEQNARAMLSAQGDLDEYRKELEALAAAAGTPSPDGAETPHVVDLTCRGARDIDVQRLSVDHWRRVDRADGPDAPDHP